MVSLVSPDARSPSNRETGNRSPRMQGLPVQTCGSTVMRSNFTVFTSPALCRLKLVSSLFALPPNPPGNPGGSSNTKAKPITRGPLMHDLVFPRPIPTRGRSASPCGIFPGPDATSCLPSPHHYSFAPMPPFSLPISARDPPLLHSSVSTFHRPPATRLATPSLHPSVSPVLRFSLSPHAFRLSLSRPPLSVLGSRLSARCSPLPLCTPVPRLRRSALGAQSSCLPRPWPSRMPRASLREEKEF